MDLFKKLIDAFFLEKEKIKDNINQTNTKLQVLFNNLEQLSLIDRQFDVDITSVDTKMLKNIFKSLNNNSISDEELDTLDETKKIIQYLYDPKLPNIGIKRAKLLFISEFKNKVKSIINEVNGEIDKLNISLSAYKDMNEKIDRYLGIIGVENFYLKTSIDKLNDLFDFLELTSVDKDLVLELVSIITIERLRYDEKLNKESSLEQIEEEIEKNAENLIGVDNKSQQIEKIDLSLLSDEERNLLGQLEKLFSDNNIVNDENLFGIVKGEFVHFNIDERMECYFTENNLVWDIIAADYYSNLLPNINSHKEEVLSIIKFIIDEEKKIKNVRLEENEKLQKQIKEFREHYGVAEEIRNDYYSNRGEYYSKMTEEEKSNFDNLISEMFILSNEIVDRIEKNDIDSEELRIVNLQFDKYMLELQNYLSVKNDIVISNGYNLDTTKTLVLLLKDGIGNFVPVREIENEILQDVSSRKNNELQKSIIMMSEKGMSDSKKRLGSSHVDKKSSTGGKVLLKDHFKFDVDRLRFSASGRTGYVIVPVHEENRKKLMSVYGNHVFYQNYNSLILIIGSICCNADHSEYDSFKDLIEENMSYVRYIIDLFKNPNADVEKMKTIVEESAKECKRISSGYGRGGK